LQKSSVPKDRSRPASPVSRGVRLPLVSGKVSALVLGGCLLLAALMGLPLARRFPPWVDFEIVLAAWWLIWATALGTLLYRGFSISDDHRIGETRNWFAGLFGARPLHERPDDVWWWPRWPIYGLTGSTGCLECIVLVVGMVVAALAAWLLVELLIPVWAFVMYFLIRGMLASAVNGAEHCRGHLARATACALLWATAYTAPLAILVWGAHQLHRARSG
jgi:hypothetical protein